VCVGGAGGGRDNIESHGSGDGEGAAAGSRASALSLPSSSSAARHVHWTAEQKAARVRPPRLSELIDFAPRGGGGGGVNAIPSSEGEEGKETEK
jgi:hypothetical protein